ncbi:hypothetical protein AVEN_155020-1 [Araneus ventricosus]|uniref:Uncharacterized protein n=1 Tax=Araneus ventricosus TaxID=182803 RepID=A0A4Y2A902_ARAVE|nr:hypothetical protein AVEN_155020-1 [Araneus ventricosus]
MHHSTLFNKTLLRRGHRSLSMCHPSCGPHTTFSKTERGIPPEILGTVMIGCPLRSTRSGPHQNRPWTSNKPIGKSHMRGSRENGHGECCVQVAMRCPRRSIVILKMLYALAEKVLLLN